MLQPKPIFLPGTDKQLISLFDNIEVTGKSVLVIGTGTEVIAGALTEAGTDVIIIVEDQESLLQLRYLTADFKSTSVRMMEFDNTDFKDERFDIVYSQASVSNPGRNKIVKELKRVLKPGGIFCVGEIVNLKKEVPRFVNDIWKHSTLAPMFIDDLAAYYKDRNFEIIYEKDLSSTMIDYYSLNNTRLKNNIDKLTDQEISYYKKVLKKISHESNAYSNLGGDEYMGYSMLILKKM